VRRKETLRLFDDGTREYNFARRTVLLKWREGFRFDNSVDFSITKMCDDGAEKHIVQGGIHVSDVTEAYRYKVERLPDRFNENPTVDKPYASRTLYKVCADGVYFFIRGVKNYTALYPKDGVAFSILRPEHCLPDAAVKDFCQ